MAQNTVDYTTDPSGDQLMDTMLPDQVENFLTKHSGTSRPSYVLECTDWIDKTTTPWVWNFFDGADDIIIGTINATTNVFTPAGGTGQVKISAADTTADYLNPSILVGTGLTKTITSPGSDEKLTLAVDFTQVASLAQFSGFRSLLMYGLTLSNNVTDVVNDIDIAAGIGISDDGTTPMTGTSMTKRLDVTWSAGNNGGFLDTGSIANTTYHIYQISKNAGVDVDYVATATYGSPTMPASYTKKVYLGSIIRDSGAILQFVQFDQEFIWKDGTKDELTTNGTGADQTTTLAFSPNGIKTKAMLTVLISSNGQQLYASSLDTTAIALSAYNAQVSGNAVNEVGTIEVFTNASKQIRIRATSGAPYYIGNTGYRNHNIRR